MSAPTRCMQILILAMLTLALPDADAFARPPNAKAGNPADQAEHVTPNTASTPAARAVPTGRSKSTSAALVGRVRTRHRTVDLTRETLAQGGPAHDLAEATARIIADAEVMRESDRNLEPDCVHGASFQRRH